MARPADHDPESHRLSIARELPAIGPVADLVHRLAAGVLDEDGVAAVELALVEALTNAILHGTLESAARIEIAITLGADAMVIEIIDSSPPMPLFLLQDAGEHKMAFDPDDLYSIPESGRGLSLIVMSMDEVTYRHVGDKTHLRMRRNRLH